MKRLLTSILVSGHLLISSVNAQDRDLVTKELGKSIVAVESEGKPNKIGSAGERGIMQLNWAAWRGATQKLYGRVLPFDIAFKAETNLKVGEEYLRIIERRFSEYFGKEWNDLSYIGKQEMIIAGYTAGANNVIKKRGVIEELGKQKADYVRRVRNLVEDQERKDNNFVTYR